MFDYSNNCNMGRVSKRKINPYIEKRILEIFLDYFANLKTPNDINAFLVSLLSPTEQIMISKRLAIAVLLSRGFNYEYIDHNLKVSKSTVATIHRQLMTGALGYKKAIEYILKKENREGLWNSLEEFFIQLSPPKAYGSLGWEKKSEAGKKIERRKKELSSL